MSSATPASRHDKAGLTGLAICGAIVACALLAPWLSPHDPAAIDLGRRLLPPAWSDGGSIAYPLGTDGLGRDMLSRLIYGSRVSLCVGIAASVVAGGLGFLLGLISGYFSGLVDRAVALLVDALLSLPLLLVMIAFSAVLGQGFASLVLVIGLTTWVTYARVTRSEVISLKERPFVKAARSMGASHPYILLVHIAPNVLSTFIVLATTGVASAILAEASMGFLGFGVGSQTISWGAMLNDGRPYLATSWWVAVLPGAAITLAILGVGLTGDLLRDRLDPRLKDVIA
jgi:peptide/nickel transport system permease protein